MGLDVRPPMPTILNVLREREYVEMEKKRFIPTDTGDWVNKFLVSSFGDIVDPKFTASVEDKLDAVARGETGWKPLLRDFWKPFKAAVDKAASAERPTEDPGETCPGVWQTAGYQAWALRASFMACTGYPECKHAKPLAKERRR